MIKKCVLCEVEFNISTQRRYCYSCVPQKWDEKGYASTIKRTMKKKAVDLRGGKCERCGYDKYVGALQFHHIDPSSKDFRLGDGYTHSWEDFLNESNKCQLLCANCHAELHFEELP